MRSQHTSGILILLVVLLSHSMVCWAESDSEDNLADFQRALRGDDSFSRIYRSGSDDDKRSETQFSRIYRQTAQPSFSRILRGGPASFSRILRGGPASFSRILRGGESLSRILRSEPAAGTVSGTAGEDEKRLSRILRAPEFSRLLRSQTFSRILKRSGANEDEDLMLDDDGEEFEKRAPVDFSRILRSPPSFSRIL